MRQTDISYASEEQKKIDNDRKVEIKDECKWKSPRRKEVAKARNE